eukprot:scaffold10922_cov147-Cylindrotheca_fusiformis.AAC.2
MSADSFIHFLLGSAPVTRNSNDGNESIKLESHHRLLPPDALFRKFILSTPSSLHCCLRYRLSHHNGWRCCNHSSAQLISWPERFLTNNNNRVLPSMMSSSSIASSWFVFYIESEDWTSIRRECSHEKDERATRRDEPTIIVGETLVWSFGILS